MDIGGWDEEFQGGWGWDDVDVATRLTYYGVGQFVDTQIEAIHQWHLSLPPDLQYEASMKNEARFKSKKREDYIANIGREWGKIIPKNL